MPTYLSQKVNKTESTQCSWSHAVGLRTGSSASCCSEDICTGHQTISCLQTKLHSVWCSDSEQHSVNHLFLVLKKYILMIHGQIWTFWDHCDLEHLISFGWGIKISNRLSTLTVTEVTSCSFQTGSGCGDIRNVRSTCFPISALNAFSRRLPKEVESCPWNCYGK